MGAKKIAAVAALVVVIVIALIFVVKQSGVTGSTSKPPKAVLERMIEKVDSNTGDVVTKQYQEWLALGQKDGLYKNEATGQYTMAIPLVCGACGAKIPLPSTPEEFKTQTADMAAMMKWQATVKCPKCGKNPFVSAPPPNRKR